LLREKIRFSSLSLIIPRAAVTKIPTALALRSLELSTRRPNSANSPGCWPFYGKKATLTCTSVEEHW